MRKYYKRTPKVLGKKIKQLRAEKKLSQEDLAEMTGVTTVYIGYIEQGRRVPSLKTTDKIARALGIKITDLLG
ncbi:MAG: helix-turn-helix transcriptional regulator [Candidatus Pacebacteria bacterium]|jgi:transcriptional regulator with XRE-family HTH domain|nr:helix-turn-helix transcriptional regulator [Candidatus Paceibacterota bacterium]MBT3511879.1 helix-turn-helix transcriptional regulator [Candidatus Paceibacterota bacterium]MBT4005366.1 helix-turn-helix transcriptional regulator [Candidatus Paceibacterota bacterium]MBT4359267.1 helix-turn-helix transcriptional regulator [Candidatus Paceibacterota bacterium]MBT4680898.1 helix-turn-helix transcriptional regulator [Candidatus Paceibacterota bacterium]